MARRENSDAYELLKLNGISTDELFTHAVDYLHWEQGAPVRGKKEAVTTKLLEQFSEDLILKASGMDPVIGREREIDTVIGILCRKNKNNPALVCPAQYPVPAGWRRCSRPASVPHAACG